VRPKRPVGDVALYRRMLAEARPLWPALALLGVIDLLKVPLLLLQPIPLKIIVDNVVGGQPLPELVARLVGGGSASWYAVLLLAIGLMLAVTLLDKLRGAFGWVLNVRTGESLALRFRTRLFDHLQRLSLSYHDSAGTADSIYRVERDADSIQSISIGFLPYIVALFTMAGMLVVTIRIDWQLALVALVASPLAIILIATQRRSVRRKWDEIFEHRTRALNVVHEALSAARVVKAFGREDRESARFARHGTLSLQRQVSATRFEAGLDALVNLFFTLCTAAVLFLGVIHVQEGRITLGELLIFLTYLGHLHGPLEMLSRFSADLQQSFASAARACAVLDLEPEIVDRPKALPLSRARGAISFRGVNFAYPTGGPVLHDISFDVPAGCRVGIFGPTGAGKTTLINLLARFYDPTTGQVLLDGVDLRDYRVADLRKQFGIVLQDPVLFSASIAENIAYARPDASEEEIVDAASAANAHDFIRRLPDGYRTLVGERGMRLSGGERQRVSLARAYLRDAPILILDEPTSSIDVATESEIMESMHRLMEGRTTFMIAHRLGTLDICDSRIELRDGRIVRIDLQTHVPVGLLTPAGGIA
jgi:ATP-binding cassette, subfamily B, bacterial